MMSFETYKDNLSIADENGIKNIAISRNVICKGSLSNIIKEKDCGRDDIRPMAAAVIGEKNTDATLTLPKLSSDYWTDHDAQESFLDSKPVCYLILGKPGTGAYTLGEALSKKLNCIHLCPKNVIQDEMEQHSVTGNCIEFNLKQQNVIKYDIILSILKKKLKSPAVQHRGYVLSGLPFIDSDRKVQYLSNTLYSEEGVLVIDDVLYDVLVNMKKKKPKKPRASTGSPHTSLTSEQEVQGEVEEEIEEEQEPEENLEEEEQEPVVELPKFLLDLCSDIIFSKKPCIHTKQSVYLEQINSMLNLSMAPDIILYLTCPNQDLLIKRNHKYYNYQNNTYTVDSFFPNIESEVRWPLKSSMNDYINPHDIHVFNPKYNCKLPTNFIKQSKEQICNYKRFVLPFVEKKLTDFEPKNIIKLDGRTSVHQMMHNINEKLLLLSIKPVFIPEPLYLEEPPEEMEEFWKLVEELNVIRSGNLNFNRYPSLWLDRCPVELKKRRSVIGKTKLAVSFFKHVYLLSSLEHMVSFCRNPRPFLKLEYLEPTCRVIIVGTPLSGKTMVSRCLSWLFDAPVINYEVFLADEKEKKYNTYAKSILSEIIATIEDDRFLKWRNKEEERIRMLAKWNDNNFKLFKTYVALFLDILKFSKKDHSPEEEEEQEGVETEELDPQLLANYNNLRSSLSFLPILDDIDQCLSAIEVKTLVKFAPKELTTVTDKPGTPALGDTDVTIAIANYIAANDLQKEIEPTNEELMNEMVKVLTEGDEESLQQFKTYKKFIIDGFPSDPEFWGFLSDAKLLPDHTIALIENREIVPELVEYYKEITKCEKSYDERISMANDPLIKIKLLTKAFPDTNNAVMKRFVDKSINLVLDTIFIEETQDSEYAKTEPNKIETAAIEKFREDWDSLKLKLEENSKLFIEIELENKTDIQVIEEVLLNLRKNYNLTCEIIEGEESEPQEDEENISKDVLTYNDPRDLCETNIYCPVAFYDYGVLWEGKSEFSVKLNNKLHYFCKEECLGLFSKDATRYQEYNIPFKSFSPLRICVIGCIGSGKSTVSKFIAKELGLIHIDFREIINDYLIPRHFKKVGLQYENSFTDSPIDEEGVTEFQMNEENENLISDILGNETELRRMVYNYFERGSPLLSVLMQRLIKKLWFEKPFASTGFVLDGFPRLPSDVEDMVACFCIPDLVIELEGTSESMLQRLSLKMYKTWRIQLNEAKRKAKLKLDNEIRMWMNFITKNVVVKLIFENLLDNTFAIVEEPPKLLSAKSLIMDAHPQGSSNVDVNLFTFYNDMTQEYPSPVDQSEWEKPDEARERIDARLESLYEVDDEGIQSLKEILDEQRIRVISMDGTKPLNKLLRIVFFKLTNLRNRCISMLEQTFLVSCDVAEILLLEGFYHFSKFNRMCPVFIFENPSTIMNPFKIMKRKEQVFTVIHKAYIYFIFGEESLRKFRTNPLKYVNTDVMNTFKEFPITVSIIGSPKSGKSTLAAKLAKRYGLMYISRGIAIRHVLENMYWTELGTQMKDALSKGDCIHFEHIIKAVQTVAIDHRPMTYGFVFDGFPESASEAMELVNAGLYPNIVFDISNDKDLATKHSLNEIFYDILKRNPPYSAPYIEYRYNNWSNKKYQLRNWIQEDVQNVCPINGKKSRWQCRQDATSFIEGTFNKIHYYLNNVNNTIVSTNCMCITNKVFWSRASPFKNMCPLCLKNNVFRNSTHPVDKKGVVQYNDKYFWICSDHINIVLKDPELYLLQNQVTIPEVPAVVNTVNTTLVYENGICIVTYAENLPNQRIVMGSHKYAAAFHGNTYMFCSAKCLEKFLAKPRLYYDITVFQETKMFPQLSLKKLPHIGYLEQTVGNVITDACCSVNVLRPKYPGLDIKLSGLLYIALYLKTHNPKVEKPVFELFDKAAKVYDARCKLIIDLGLRLRAMDNPFVKYPKCCNRLTQLDSGTLRKPSSMTNESSSVNTAVSEVPSRVPVPDERYDYLCNFHKPASKVPAFLNVVDIAGLVRGAAEGQGLGNAFLSHIKACDAIFNLCRAFDDEDVIHVDGEVNPVRDLETIGEELRLKDEEQLMKDIEKLDRVVNRGGDKKLKPEYEALMKIKTILVDEKKHIRFGDWSAADIEVLNKYLFLTSKPALYLVNLSEKDYIRKKNKWLPKLKEWIDKNDPGAPLIPFSGCLETKLLDMEPAERDAFLKENNLTSALDKIIVQGYKALQLEYFFTAGPDEVKAWTIQKGTKAPQAAGRIHTDFEKGFIMAEVMHFKDFREEGTEAACKAAGKYRQQGRNYVVEDGDIIFFKFNAGAGLKDAKKK